MFCPLLLLPFYPTEVYCASGFILPSCVSMLLGYFICLKKPYKKTVSHSWQSLIQKGSVPVLFVWVYAFLVGSVPFMMIEHMSFTLALFESVSGWTTTGLTVVDAENIPHLLLFHRSFMQFCGGLGFVIMIAVVARKQAATSLYDAEGHSDKLKPSIRRTAETISILYFIWLVAGTIAYAIFGMPVLDSVCHTMSAISTAGFSTKNASIAAYDSLGIDVVTIVLMLVGALNFYVIMLLMKGKIGRALRETELQVMIAVTVVFSLLITLDLYSHSDMSFGDSLLQGTFGVVTAFTTTGYSLMDYYLWPAFSIGMFMILMVIGGSTGSTAGGIKLIRTWLTIRIAFDNLRKQMSPEKAVFSFSYRKGQTDVSITPVVREKTVGFVIIYIFVLCIGTLAVTLTSDCSLLEAAYEFASALGTVGVSNGLTGPDAPAATLYIEMFGMFLGRLEIIMVFAGMYFGTKSIWRKIRKTT